MEPAKPAVPVKVDGDHDPELGVEMDVPGGPKQYYKEHTPEEGAALQEELDGAIDETEEATPAEEPKKATTAAKKSDQNKSGAPADLETK